MKALFFILLISCSLGVAKGQEKKNPENTSNTAANEQIGAQGKPLLIQRIKSAEEKAEEEKNAAEAKQNTEIQRAALKVSQDSLITNQETLNQTTRAAWAAVVASAIAVLAVIVGVVQLIMFLRQLGVMGETNKAARDAASAALIQSESIQQAERAYVQLSHARPGIRQGEPFHWIMMNIKNFGKTPATITAVNISIFSQGKDDPLPAVPKYEPTQVQKRNNAFLVPEGELFFPVDINGPVTGNDVFYVIGYVDYIDTFGSGHRAGYGRRYEPWFDKQGYMTDEDFAKRSNLLHVGGAEYNYDRPHEQ